MNDDSFEEEKEAAIAGMIAATEGLKGKELKQALSDYIKELPVEAEGEKTVLYSNSIRENKIHTGDIVEALQEKNEEAFVSGGKNKFRLIDDTIAAEVLMSKKFKEKVAEALELPGDTIDEKLDAYEQLRDGTDKYNERTDFLYDGKNGLWAEKSRQFTSLTEGEVIIVAENPKEHSVLVQTEMMNLLNDSKATKINNISVETLKDIVGDKGEDYANSTIISLSATQTIATDLTPENIATWEKTDNFEKMVEVVGNASEQISKELTNKLDEHRTNFGDYESLSKIALTEIARENQIQSTELGRNYTGRVMGFDDSEVITKSATGKYFQHEQSFADNVSITTLNEKVKISYGLEENEKPTLTQLEKPQAINEINNQFNYDHGRDMN